MSQDQDSYTFEGFSSPNFTQVPDEAFDQLMPILSGAEWKVLCYIIRRTFGFKKDSDSISLSQMVDGITTHDGKQLDLGTGLSKASVATAIKSLAERGVIRAVRNQSQEHGYEATTYELRFRDPLSKNQTRGSSKIGQALVQKSDIQETVLQETVEQQTGESPFSPLPESGDISPSKFRKRTREKNSTERNKNTQPRTALEESVTASEGIPSSLGRSSDTAPSVRGFSTPGALLARRPEPRSRAEKATSRTQATSARPAFSQPADEEDRVFVGAYVRDFSWKLHDRAKLKTSVTRAYNLFQEVQPYDRQNFTELMHVAYRKTQEQANIRGSKMAYWFGVLERELGLKELPNPGFPMRPQTEPPAPSASPQWRRPQDPEYANRRKNYVRVISRPSSEQEIAPE